MSFATPPNHKLLSNLGATPPGSVTDQLLPGDDSLAGFDASFVELGTVRVNLFDRSKPVGTPGQVIRGDLGIDLIDPGGIALTDRSPTGHLLRPTQATPTP